MAELESSLVTYLIGLAGVQAEFGSGSTHRLYVDHKDERITTVYPFAIIRTVFENSRYAHDGTLPDDSLIQVDVFSDSKTTANSAVTALRTALSGFSGTMDASTVGSIFVRNVRGTFDPESQLFVRSVDFQIAQDG
jgi:hypothetical protein